MIFTMCKKLTILFFLQAFIYSSYGQANFDKEPFQFTNTLLKSGEYKVDLMTIDFPFETKMLMLKMSEAVAKDSAWFISYLNDHVKDSGKLKYDKRFGLTEVEYNQMQNGISEGKKYVKTGEEKLTITNTDTAIQFQGTGEIMEISNLFVDKKNKTVKFKQIIIPYKNEIHADDRTVVKAWDGHQFRLEEINSTDLTKIMEIRSKSYRLLVGKVQRSQKKYLKLEAKEINEGQKTVDIEFALLFD